MIQDGCEERLLMEDMEETSSTPPPPRTISVTNNSTNSNLMKLLFAIMVGIFLVYLVSTASSSLNSTESRRVHQLVDSDKISVISGKKEHYHMPKDDSYKYVLLYSDFYDNDRNWYLGTNLITTPYFEDLKCPQTRCTITSNRSFLSSIRDFDALLFFAHNRGDMPSYPDPRERRPEQIYIVSMLETPPHTWRTFEHDHQYFNWTMSFRFESDVFWPYGYFVEYETDNVITPSLQPIWRHLDEDHFNTRPYFKNETLRQLILNKSKMAAWFVSNCNLTPSKRMQIAKDMRKFIHVDIYGNCGELKCSKNEHHQCQQMLENDYKFYLSFENSLCQDYITEKVFSNMNYFIIPVIYNAAENSHFLPPGSYINVLDYSSIKELTDYMTYLAANPEEYMKYFWWKEFYYIRSGYNFCDLCVKMHEKGLTERRQNYNDLDKWYRSDACVATPHIPLEPEPLKNSSTIPSIGNSSLSEIL